MNKNRGTGAGGSNTNKNGLSYENKTFLPSASSSDVNSDVRAWEILFVRSIFELRFRRDLCHVADEVG